MKKNTIIGITSAFILSFVLLSSTIADEIAIIRVKDRTTNNPIFGAQVTVIRDSIEEPERHVLFQGPTNSSGEIRLTLSSSDAATAGRNILYWAEKTGYVTYGTSSGLTRRDGMTLSGELSLVPILAPTPEMLRGGTSRVLVKIREFKSLREFQAARAAGRLDIGPYPLVEGANVNVNLVSISGSNLASPTTPGTPQLGEDPQYFYGYSRTSAPSIFWLDIPGRITTSLARINAYKPGYISTFGAIGIYEFWTYIPGISPPEHSYIVCVPLIKIPGVTLRRRPLAPITPPVRIPPAR